MLPGPGDGVAGELRPSLFAPEHKGDSQGAEGDPGRTLRRRQPDSHPDGLTQGQDLRDLVLRLRVLDPERLDAVRGLQPEQACVLLSRDSEPQCPERAEEADQSYGDGAEP